MLFLKPTQQKAIDAANDPRVSTIVLIGAVGTGKTDVAAHASISIAYSFPRTYWPVFRQNISTAKRSVIPSYLNMLDLMNLEEGIDYRYNRQDFEIIFDHNGSRGLDVQEFISGATPTSDKYDKLRSEVIYFFAQGLERGEIKIYEGCPYRNELISEAMAHNHKTTDKKLAVEARKKSRNAPDL
jgi:hypothetical protein